jgi:hypothetical protein
MPSRHGLPLPNTASTEPNNTLRNRAIFFIIACFLVTCGLFYIASMSNGSTEDNFLFLLVGFMAVAFVTIFAIVMLSTVFEFS